MAKFEITAFGGIRPSDSDRLRRMPYGTVAHNLDLRSGSFVPMVKPKTVAPSLNGGTLHLLDDQGRVGKRQLVSFKEDVSIVPFSCMSGEPPRGHLVFCHSEPDPTSCGGEIEELPEDCFGPVRHENPLERSSAPAWLPENVTGYDPADAEAKRGSCPSINEVRRQARKASGTCVIDQQHAFPTTLECQKDIYPEFLDCEPGDRALHPCVANPEFAPEATLYRLPGADEFEATDASCPDAHSFVVTYLSDLGQETAPSLPATVHHVPSIYAEIMLRLPPPPPGANCVRIYRSSLPMTSVTDGRKGMELPDFYLVDTHEAEATAIMVSADTRADLGDRLCTYDTLPPPPMEQVILTGSGQYAGFMNNELYFSERYEPCNWPLKFRHTLDDRIIGITSVANETYVGTTGKPYVAQFKGISDSQDPDMEAESRVEVRPYMERHIPLYCKHAITATPYGAALASKDGLWLLSQDTVTRFTKKKIERDEWDLFLPSQLEYSGGFLYGVGNAFNFRMELEPSEAGPIYGDIVTFDMNEATDRVQDLFGGNDAQLYYDAGAGAQVWEGGDDYMLGRWRSTPVHSPSPKTWRFGKIHGRFDKPVIFRIYRGETLHFQRTVCDEHAFTLPPCPRGYDYYIEIEAATVVESVMIAPSKVAIGLGTPATQN